MSDKTEIFLNKDKNPDRKAMRSILREVIEDSKEFEKAEKSQRTMLRLTGILVVIAVLIFLMMGCSIASEPIDLGIITSIESTGNPRAFNRHSGAIGLCQITPIVLKEYNMKAKAGFKQVDLYDGKINLMIANWYMNKRIPQMLKAYRIPDTTKNRLWAYNAGIGNVRKGILPLETRNYIKRYNLLKGVSVK